MQEALKSLGFNIGYLRKSDKKRILDVLEKEQEKRQQMRKKFGVSNASALQEISFLSRELMELYRREKGPEGTDRLFSAGHEISQLLIKADLFDVFESSVLNAFKRHYQSKVDEDRTHEFYLNKARSLMSGLGDATLEKFESVIADLNISEVTQVQEEFGSKLPSDAPS